MEGAQFKCSTSFLPIPFMPESERMHFGCGIVKAGIGDFAGFPDSAALYPGYLL